MKLLDRMAAHIREFQISGEGMGALYRDLEDYDRIQALDEAVATLTISPDWGPRLNIDAENAIAKLPPGEYSLYTHPPKPAQVGEKYREPNIEDAVEVLRLAYDGEWQTGEPNIILAALQTIGARVAAREGNRER